LQANIFQYGKLQKSCISFKYLHKNVQIHLESWCSN